MEEKKHEVLQKKEFVWVGSRNEGNQLRIEFYLVKIRRNEVSKLKLTLIL